MWGRLNTELERATSHCARIVSVPVQSTHEPIFQTLKVFNVQMTFFPLITDVKLTFQQQIPF